MIDEKAFLDYLQDAINGDRLTLPTLPEVALRVRDAVEQKHATAPKIAEIVAMDAALSARLLHVANSPLYRGRVPIGSIQLAIGRLGIRLVRSLVISLIMQQIFQATSDSLDRRFRKIWEDSVQVAAISRLLARSIAHLDTDEAMLAGLIHNIGALPILVFAEGRQELVEDEQKLDFLIGKLSPIIGKQILESWAFPDSLTAVPANCRNLNYQGSDVADYVDVVLVARLQSLARSGDLDRAINWNPIPSFAKVGLNPEIHVVDLEGMADEIEEVEHIFIG